MTAHPNFDDCNLGQEGTIGLEIIEDARYRQYWYQWWRNTYEDNNNKSINQ